MASGKKLGKRSPDGSLVVFRCQGFTKLAKLFLEGTFPVHYIIVCWGMKKKQKSGVGWEKWVVTNVTPVPPGPSHLEHFPVCESLLNKVT